MRKKTTTGGRARAPANPKKDRLTLEERDALAVRYQSLAGYVVRTQFVRWLARFDDLPPPDDVPDLIGAARLGVYRASRTWEPDGGAKFITYAYKAAFNAAYNQYRFQIFGTTSRYRVKYLRTRVPTGPRRAWEGSVRAEPSALITWDADEWDLVLRPMHERQKRVLLAWLGGRSLKSIGAEMSRSAQGVQHILKKALLAAYWRHKERGVDAEGFPEELRGKNESER